MKLHIARELANHIGCEVDDTYSGRCMYGKTTAALRGEDLDHIDIACAWAQICVDAVLDATDDVAPEFNPDDLHYRTDAMGMGKVFY